MVLHKYVVVDESGNSYKYLFGSLNEAEDFAKRWSSELSRSEIMTFVLHVPATAQPRIQHADDVNQFAGEDWRVAKAYYKGRAMAKDRFKRKLIVTHEPRKAKEEARAAALKATAAEAREKREQECRAQRQAAQQASAAAMAKRRAENEAWAAKSDSTLISEARNYAKITGDTSKTDSERFKAKTQVEVRLRELTNRGRMDVQSISSELSMIAMGREPDIPPILTAPPELAADVLGTGMMGLTPTQAAKPKRKPAARTTKKPKVKKTAAAKPKKTAKPKAKKTAATPKLTAAQREYLAINGFVMVKRGGKYVRITG